MTFHLLNQIHAQLIRKPKPHLLNPILKHFVNSSNPENVLLLYNKMLCYPLSHNHYTFTLALKACFSTRARAKGLEIHAHVMKYGHFSDIYIQNSLVHFYLVENEVVSASRVFDSISHPDVVSWTSIISGLSKCGFEIESIEKFRLMDILPNSATLVSILSACSSLKQLNLGKAIHAYRLKKLNENNVILDNALLDMYAKCGSLASAEYVFVSMCVRDVVSWTTMVSGYAQKGFCEEAVAVFKKMVQEGESEPNEATLVTLLSACASVGALRLGQWVHSYINTRHDLILDGNLGNALINLYIKSGDFNMAIQVFNMLQHRDIVSWSTLISGMAMHGHGKFVMQLFSCMLINGIPPDGVTFVGLLSACSHSGLVDEGMMFFKAMRDVYGIVPQMQHYGCMVDMYGRAGLLEEAEVFIRDMPMKAEGPIWGSLLQACKIHGNEKMFERIRSYLLTSRGAGVGTLALLSNTYASSDKWDDADRVRHAMRNMGLKKMAGCSWIELNSSIHVEGSGHCFAHA